MIIFNFVLVSCFLPLALEISKEVGMFLFHFFHLFFIFFLHISIGFFVFLLFYFYFLPLHSFVVNLWFTFCDNKKGEGITSLPSCTAFYLLLLLFFYSMFLFVSFFFKDFFLHLQKRPNTNFFRISVKKQYRTESINHFHFSKNKNNWPRFVVKKMRGE